MKRATLLVVLMTVGTLLVGGAVWAATAAFAPAENYPAGDSPSDVGAADFDKDGDVDLVTANSDGNNASVLIRRPDGTFRPPRNYTAGVGPTAVVKADLDRDGDTDFATANYAGNTVSMFANKGDGTFAAQRRYAVGARPQDIRSGDVDRDGDQDLITANAGARDNPSTVSVLKNDGGTFQPPRNYYVGERAGGCCVFKLQEATGLDRGDFDGDGDLDLAVSLTYYEDNGGVAVLLNNGGGTFGKARMYRLPISGKDVVAGDLNGDGNLDLALPDSVDEDVTVYRGRGNGTFVYVDSYAVGEEAGNPHSITEADFDGDGDLDVATANWSSNKNPSENVSVLENAGDGTLGNPQVFEAGANPSDVIKVRLDGDTKPDLVAANYGSDDVSVLRNITP